MRDDLRLLDRITPLFRMRIEAPFEYAHIGICGQDSERCICSTTTASFTQANIPLLIVL